MKQYDTKAILDQLNINKQIKIETRPYPCGYVLYLCTYLDGQLYRNSTKEKITGTDRDYDMSVIKKVCIERDEKELGLMKGTFMFKTKNRTTILDYANDLKDYKTRRQYLVKPVSELVKYLNHNKCIVDITERDIEGWVQSLPFTNTRKSGYLEDIKYVFKYAIMDGITTANPASKINVKRDPAKREFLNFDEIQLVHKEGKCSNEQVKRAFLFSCFTGLRRSDLYNLKWSNIKDGFLYITQSKTKEVVRMKLNQAALDILSSQDNSKPNVFGLPTEKYINPNIKNLVNSVGIDKKITMHCARHTFATLLITYDTDIFTVSKLLGHTDISTTMIYAKLVDKKRDDAIDRLPHF